MALCRLIASGFVFLLASASGVLAQPAAIGSTPAAPPPSDWTLDVGPGLIVGPRFEGARDYRVLPIPALDLRYRRDVFFLSARDGIGGTLFDMDGFKAGPILRYRFPRNEGDSGYLTGMGDVPFTLEGGAFLRYEGSRYFSARIEARRGLGGHNGLIADAAIDGKLRLGETVFLSAGPRMSLTDGTYNQAYFGVDAAQSARSGYAPYSPGGGVKSIGAAASALWKITDKLSLVAFGSYANLRDVAGNSPIVSGPGGSRDQFVGGAAVSWRFEF